MPAPLIKICGVNTPEALEAAIAARAEYVGFNFYAPSPRYLTMSDAEPLGAQADGKIKKIGLFVDADDLIIGQAAVAAKLDGLQLHGSETPERAAALATAFNLPVWKAVRVSSAADVENALQWRGVVERVLFDAQTPMGALPGGMGLKIDWSLLSNYRAPFEWGLAGGLTPTNVGDALRITGAPLVDTSSGVETAPGVKDAARIAAFCEAARAN